VKPSRYIPLYARFKHLAWESLHLSGGSLWGHYQGEDPYILWDCLVDHQGISYYRLSPSIRDGQASIFQEASCWVIVRVKTGIVYREYA